MLIVAHIEGTHSQRELPDLFARARETGYDGVELGIGTGCTCELSEPEENCRAIAHQAQQCGTQVRSALLADSAAVRLGTTNHEPVRSAVRRCRWLGAESLRLIPAAVGAAPDGTGRTYQDALNETYSGLEAVHVDFERCGVVAGIVPCRHRFLLSPPEFRELIDRVNSPLIGAALDYGACARIGEPTDWITTLQHRLAAVSIEAGTRGKVTGDEPLSRVLRDIGFSGLLIHIGGTAGGHC